MHLAGRPRPPFSRRQSFILSSDFYLPTSMSRRDVDGEALAEPLIVSDSLLHPNKWVLSPNNSGVRLCAAIRNSE